VPAKSFAQLGQASNSAFAMSISTTLELKVAEGRIQTLLSAGKIDEANRLAMHLSDYFLARKPETVRTELFERLFLPLRNVLLPPKHAYAAQYQPLDFEIVDYELYQFAPDLPLMRGPKPDFAAVASGNYAVVLGAAQFFGRFQTRPINTILQDRFGVPVFNLAMGAAGPNRFAESSAVMSICSRAKFVVLQVLSGRSIGCDEYPGERLTRRYDQPGAALRDRITILSEIWTNSRIEALRLIRKWNENYVAAYLSLMRGIGRPIVLIWLAKRSPDDWSVETLESRMDFGDFPQLVSRETVDAIRDGAHAYIEGEHDRDAVWETKSRLTGAPAPFFTPDGAKYKEAWRNQYNVSQESIFDVVDRMAAAIDGIMKR
jgi:Domain of unknown function (DUF6473)